MADFCHEYEPGGIGCIGADPKWPQRDLFVDCVPEECFGDFTWLVRQYAPLLPIDFSQYLGICEGCGCDIYLDRGEDGVVWFEHYQHDASLEKRVVPARKRVPTTWTLKKKKEE